MLTIEPIFSKRIGSTYARLSRESHWLHRIACPGRWYGDGAVALGLKRSPRQDALQAVLSGLTPDGKVRLAENAADPGRQGGWLLNFESPPTLNALYAVAPTGFARRIETAHEHAVKAALDGLEQSVKGKEGTSMVFAMFQHQVGRAQTPALHTLVAVSNLSFLKSGRVQEIAGEDMTEHNRNKEMLYLMTYANQLERLRLQITMDGHGFKVAGVPNDAAKLLAAEFGLNQGQRSELFQAWRSPPTVYQSDLRNRWNDLGSKAGWTTEQATDLIKYTQTHHTKIAEPRTGENQNKKQDSHDLSH